MFDISSCFEQTGGQEEGYMKEAPGWSKWVLLGAIIVALVIIIAVVGFVIGRVTFETMCGSCSGGGPCAGKAPKKKL